jgi:hypothetical protein
MSKLPLHSRKGSLRGWAEVDDADFAELASWSWWLSTRGYVQRNVLRPGRGIIVLSRHLLGLTPADRDWFVDHIDRNRLNNCRSNLRVVDRHSPNAQNVSSHRDSTSSFRGVSWDKRRRRWIAQVRVAGHKPYFGIFHTEEEAGEAARAARLRLMPYAVD